MCQIWVQWSHFSALMGYCCFWWCFITKVWSDHHTWWSPYSSTAIGTPCPKSGCSGHTFRRWWVTVVFYGVSLQKYVQVLWPWWVSWPLVGFVTLAGLCVGFDGSDSPGRSGWSFGPDRSFVPDGSWSMDERIFTLVHVLLTLSGDCSEATIHPPYHTCRPQAALFPRYNAVPLVSKLNPWFWPCSITNT